MAELILWLMAQINETESLITTAQKGGFTVAETIERSRAVVLQETLNMARSIHERTIP